MNRLGQFGFSIPMPSGIATAAAGMVKEAAEEAAEAVSCMDEKEQIKSLKSQRIMIGLGSAVLGIIIGYFAGKNL